MKKYLNKGLMYKEWKSSKWYFLLFMLQSLYWMLIFNGLIRSIRQALAQGVEISLMNKSFFTRFMVNSGTFSYGFLIVVIIFATVIAGDDFNGRKYEELCTMPFKREHIVFNKWFVGTMILLIPLMLTTIFYLIGYSLNRDILVVSASYGIILKWFVLFSLITIFIFTFIMLIEFLTGKNVIGGIFGTIFLFFPLGFSALIDMFTRITQGNTALWKVASSFVEGFSHFAILISPVIYGVGDTFEAPTLLFRAVVLIVGIALCLLLSMYAFKKYSIENIGYIVAFKKLETVFNLGVSVCFGLLFGSIYGLYTIDAKRLYPAASDFNVPVATINKYIFFTVLVALAAGIVTYLVVRKIVEANKN